MRKRETLLDKARKWTPKVDDSFGEDRKRFLDYLLSNCQNKKNAQPIDKILRSITFLRKYTKEQFQHQIIVPFREERNVFIGTSSKGIYLITEAEDAFTTINFYLHRIGSERKHLKNLIRLARRNQLFENYSPSPPSSEIKHIFVDESGTPTLSDVVQQPHYIVTAIIVKGKKTERTLSKKLNYLRELLNKSPDFEFKSSSLNKREYKTTLTELSTLDYEFGTACFIKKKLNSEGFNNPKSFYKYAHKFLLEEVIEQVGTVNLIVDESSNKESKFYKEFKKYLEKENRQLPLINLRDIRFVDSRKSPFVQVADLISGVFKNRLAGKFDFTYLIEDKMINVEFFPNF